MVAIDAGELNAPLSSMNPYIHLVKPRELAAWANKEKLPLSGPWKLLLEEENRKAASQSALPQPQSDDDQVQPATRVQVPDYQVDSDGDVNTIECDGGVWSITYQGKTFRNKHQVGFTYIAYLIEHAAEEMSCASLVSLFSTSKDGELYQDSDSVVETQTPDYYKSTSDGIRAVVETDQKALREYKVALNNCHVELEAAKESGDTARAQVLESELSQLEPTIAKASNPNSNRMRNPECKKAIDSVRNSINRVLDKMEHKHTALHKHLKECLTIKHHCIYAPEPHVEWDILWPNRTDKPSS
jgi:hypothetical protein